MLEFAVFLLALHVSVSIAIWLVRNFGRFLNKLLNLAIGCMALFGTIVLAVIVLAVMYA